MVERGRSFPLHAPSRRRCVERKDRLKFTFWPSFFFSPFFVSFTVLSLFVDFFSLFLVVHLHAVIVVGVVVVLPLEGNCILASFCSFLLLSFFYDPIAYVVRVVTRFVK